MLLNYPFDCENKALARRKVQAEGFVEKTDDAPKVSVKPGKTAVYYRENGWVFRREKPKGRKCVALKTKGGFWKF